jgi:hypothetical protein
MFERAEGLCIPGLKARVIGNERKQSWRFSYSTYCEESPMRQVFKALTSLMLAVAVCVPAFGLTALAADAAKQTGGSGDARAAEDKDFPKLVKPGDKVVLDADYYFIYGFNKPPKMGTAIMKVEIFTREGKKDTSFVVKGDLDMPSMRGAHSTGEKEFELSKNGAYLLPSHLVMPGGWEFKFRFEKNGKTVFRGAYLFDI